MADQNTESSGNYIDCPVVNINIVRANQYAVDHADYLIAYVNHPGSNPQNLLEYAKRKGLCVTNLALHEDG